MIKLSENVGYILKIFWVVSEINSLLLKSVSVNLPAILSDTK